MTSHLKPKTIAIIPARYGSTRLPAKLLIEVHGKSLIQHTYENALKCGCLDRLLVATDDQRIYDMVEGFGGEVVMTSDNCRNGTERVEEAVSQISDIQPNDIILNIQGDEPLLSSSIIESVVGVLQDSDAKMSTAITPYDFSGGDSSSDVKCVIDLEGYALYFSRSLIPGCQKPEDQKQIQYYKHIGIYGFRRQFLSEYSKLPSTPLQQAESLEQLKALEHGHKIKTVIVEGVNIGVDTHDDVKLVEQYLCKQNTSSSQAESVPPSEKD